MVLEGLRNSFGSLSLRKKAKFVKKPPPNEMSKLDAIDFRLRSAEDFIIDPENDYVSQAVSDSIAQLRVRLDEQRKLSGINATKASSKKMMEREALEISRLDTAMSSIEETLTAQRTAYAAGQSRATSRQSSNLSPSSTDSKNLISIEMEDNVSHMYVVDPVPLTQGGFGALYVAKCDGRLDLALKRPLTTGIPDEGVLRRFDREAKIWKRLRHPNILRFYGTVSWDRMIHLVSPFEERGNLHKWILANPAISRARVIKDVANGLNYMHTFPHDQGVGIVHGDIKAVNCVVGRQDIVMLCDFGLSKEAGRDTSAGQIGHGSTRWQAPELWEDGITHKTIESDVYAFAMLITEVLTERLPFGEMGDPAIIKSVSSGDYRPKQSPLSNDKSGEGYSLLWQIASRCWLRDPQARPTMNKVLEDLD